MGQRHFDPWVIAAVAVGLALRFVNLGAAALWFDETFTFGHVLVPWSELPGRVAADNQAPIYYATLKAWTEVAGLSPFALRVPGVLASAACIPLIAAIARILAGDRVARTAAWLAAISPFLIQHAQDARPYALLSMFAMADLLLLVRFVTGRSRRLGVLWVAGAIAVVATHYYGIFLLAGEGLALLLLRPRPIAAWLPAGAVAGAACSAIVLAAARASRVVFGGDYAFGGTALPGVVWSMLTGYTLMPSSEELHTLGAQAILPYLPMALAALPAFAIVAVAGLRALTIPARVLLLTAFGVALLTPFLYRLVAGAGVHPRYFAAAFAPLLIVVAAGMAPDELRSVRGGATVVLAIVMAWATVRHLADTDHGREDVYAAGRWLDANVPPDEEILITSDEMERLARFHWPERHFRSYPAERRAVTTANVPALVEALPFGGRERAIFLFGRAWLSDPDGELRRALAARYPRCPGTAVPGIDILCFRPLGAAPQAAS
ncbi:MAG: glycosyltransferase family 39 protein [Candidatus Binatia bacterium]